MSASQFSDTIIRNILNVIIKNYDNEAEDLPNILPAGTGGTWHTKALAARTTSLTGLATRAYTNPNQTGLFTQEGLNSLAQDFSNARRDPATYLRTDKYSAVYRASNVPELKAYMETQEKRNIEFKDAVEPLLFAASKIFSDKDLYDKFYNYLIAQGVDISPADPSNKGTFTIPNLSHRGINDKFNEYLIATRVDPVVVELIYSNTDAGHFLGIFTQRLMRATGIVANLATIPGDPNPARIEIIRQGSSAHPEDQKLDMIFRDMIQLLTNADYLKSSLLNNLTLAINSTKEVYGGKAGTSVGSTASIEMGKINSIAGTKLSTAGKQLTGLIKRAQVEATKAASYQGNNPEPIEQATRDKLEALFGGLESLAIYITTLSQEVLKNKQLSKRAKRTVKILAADSSRIARALIQSKGSDSMMDAIKNNLSSILAGKRAPTKQITTVKNEGILSKQTNNRLQTPGIKKVTSSTSKPFSPGIIKAIKPKAAAKTTNLISLQNLINEHLAKQIQGNMGTGNSRRVLNYRSGTLARSAKVERMSESRKGMITAFYNYMRNPYQYAFGEGGSQEYPQSRNPKLLIAKSIREIAGTQIANRMRAVLV